MLNWMFWRKKLTREFYPSCAQITVTGGTGSSLPTGVALPGAYRADDTDGVSALE